LRDEFLEYVLARLPEPPARVLEVGCGDAGGLAPALAESGYDVLAIDPVAPEGPLYRRTTLEELDDPGPFGAVVAGRVLHHLDPLGPALDRLAGLAPLLMVDEFDRDRIDQGARDWYTVEYRRLAARGDPPHAPSDLGEWQTAHPGLHPYGVLREELDLRYELRDLVWVPYLHRWLRDEAAKVREERSIDVGELEPIGFRYTGLVRASVRGSAS
jgi:methyltransferase family protein